MPIQDFFTKHPLYEVIPPSNGDNDNKNILYAYSILYGDATFDMFCVECGSHSVFKQKKRHYSGSLYQVGSERIPKIDDGTYYVTAYCSRNNQHEVMVLLQCRNLHLQKIGQFPPLADILTPDLKRYKSAIGTKRVRDWSRAIGLTSHGIGAGAFVYLRRVLESLIEEAHQHASANNDNWDEDAYTRARFTEKVSMLSGHLPTFMVENKEAYSILSKGVHELDEQTCLKYFPVLSAAIELIAEEKIAEIEIEKRRKATQDAISQITNEVKK